MTSENEEQIAGFERIKGWLAIMAEGNVERPTIISAGGGSSAITALSALGESRDGPYPATRYRTMVSPLRTEEAPSAGLDLVLLAGAESGGQLPGVELGGRRLATEEFFFSLLDDEVVLSLHLGLSCQADGGLYREAIVTFTATGSGFSGTIASTCKKRSVFLGWTGKAG